MTRVFPTKANIKYHRIVCSDVRESTEDWLSARLPVLLKRLTKRYEHFYLLDRHVISPGFGIANQSYVKNSLSHVRFRTIHRFIVENSTDLHEYWIRAKAIKFSQYISVCTEVDLSYDFISMVFQFWTLRDNLYAATDFETFRTRRLLLLPPPPFAINAYFMSRSSPCTIGTTAWCLPDEYLKRLFNGLSAISFSIYTVFMNAF